jgi:hypothetical protein
MRRLHDSQLPTRFALSPLQRPKKDVGSADAGVVLILLVLPRETSISIVPFLYGICPNLFFPRFRPRFKA